MIDWILWVLTVIGFFTVAGGIIYGVFWFFTDRQEHMDSHDTIDFKLAALKADVEDLQVQCSIKKAG
jgi:hypothetical protein